jgi:hypothetical protein
VITGFQIPVNNNSLDTTGSVPRGVPFLTASTAAAVAAAPTLAAAAPALLNCHAATLAESSAVAGGGTNNSSKQGKHGLRMSRVANSKVGHAGSGADSDSDTITAIDTTVRPAGPLRLALGKAAASRQLATATGSPHKKAAVTVKRSSGLSGAVSPLKPKAAATAAGGAGDVQPLKDQSGNTNIKSGTSNFKTAVAPSPSHSLLQGWPWGGASKASPAPAVTAAAVKAVAITTGKPAATGVKPGGVAAAVAGAGKTAGPAGTKAQLVSSNNKGGGGAGGGGGVGWEALLPRVNVVRLVWGGNKV